ncbi:MAG: RES family NAD+ phosphorylase [Proteobacteria bacterium]|nr:RES family NAD+ phosphorylase [Pseudomonadota bacterium]
MIAFNGPVWRLLAEQLVGSPTAPATAPEGRFHHSGQIAAYASLSAEGAEVAIQRYLADGRKRMLVPMWLKAQAVTDARGDLAASVVWQDQRRSGTTASTWAISDAARREGAQALLYSSRSRPELSHVVVFDTRCLTFFGPVTSMAAIDE